MWVIMFSARDGRDFHVHICMLGNFSRSGCGNSCSLVAFLSVLSTLVFRHEIRARNGSVPYDSNMLRRMGRKVTRWSFSTRYSPSRRNAAELFNFQHKSYVFFSFMDVFL